MGTRNPASPEPGSLTAGVHSGRTTDWLRQ